jgi:hypothetical protein
VVAERVKLGIGCGSRYRIGTWRVSYPGLSPPI